MKLKAKIFDVDGTLCDVRSVRHLVEGHRRLFDQFHLSSAGCPPHDWVVEAAHQAKSDGYRILVLTGRMNKWRNLTIMWLRYHEVPCDNLVMRADGDYRKDVVVKDEMWRLLVDNFEVDEAWDDNPNIVELWRSKGIKVNVVPGWTGG